MTSRQSTPLGASAIRQANLREHNLGLVLRLIIDSPVPVSRADIAVATGLTRATVSSLADRLIMASLVTELPPVMSQRAGRPAVPLVPARGTLAAVGMEINVDYLGVRVVDLSGAILAEHVEPADFRGSDPVAVMHRLSDLYCQVTKSIDDDVRMAGSCLAIPGLVDRRIGPVRMAPNLGWRDVDVVKEFHSHPATAQVQIRLDNEATLGARAEADALRPTGTLSFMYLSGEVGIGGALVVDGAVFGGRPGCAGLIGRRCPCTGHGTGQRREPDRRRERRARRHLRPACAVPHPRHRAGVAVAGAVRTLVRAAGPGRRGSGLRRADRRGVGRAIRRHRRPERLV